MNHHSDHRPDVHLTAERCRDGPATDLVDPLALPTSDAAARNVSLAQANTTQIAGINPMTTA